MPPERGASGVPRVAAIRRQVDPSDERDLAVDHDRLLVVTVHESRAAVAIGLDPRMARKSSSISRTSRCDGLNSGIGAPSTRAHARRHACELREQVATTTGSSSRDRCSSGEEPAREVDVRFGARELSGDGRERFRTVDEHLQRVPFACRKAASRTSAPMRRARAPSPRVEPAAVTAANPPPSLPGVPIFTLRLSPHLSFPHSPLAALVYGASCPRSHGLRATTPVTFF